MTDRQIDRQTNKQIDRYRGGRERERARDQARGEGGNPFALALAKEREIKQSSQHANFGPGLQYTVMVFL